MAGLKHVFKISRAPVVRSCCLVLGLAFIQFTAKGQDSTQVKSGKSDKYRPLIALQTGINGVGIEASMPVNAHWSFSLGYTFLEAGGEFTADMLGLRIINRPYINSHLVSGTGRFSIFPNGRLNLVAGLAWMKWAMEYGLGNANDLKLGSIIYTQEEVGSATLKSSNNWAITPYLGIHLGRANPKTRVAVAMDFGMFYTNGQFLEVSGTGLSSSIKREEQKLKDNFSTYKLLPQLNFQIRVKI